ncbi:MAG: GAF domain-containing protein [Anaerolineales bacterium]|nr:GAF domain-containing protein [Anaerolineales bacterium]
MTPVEQVRVPSESKLVWAEAMRATVALARYGISSESELLKAVTEELSRLNMNGTLMLLSPEGRLEVRALPSSLERTLMDIIGGKLTGYQFDPNEVEVYRQVLETRKPVFREDRRETVRNVVPTDVLPLLEEILKAVGDHPTIFAPLCVGDGVLGVMDVTAEWLKQEDIPMVECLADHIAISLNHLSATAEMELALERERLRIAAAEVAAHSRDLADVLDSVLHLAAEATGANAGAVVIIDQNSETLMLRNLFGLPQFLQERTVPRGRGIIWQLIEDREPILIDNYADRPDALQEWVEVGIRAIIGAPLISGDTIIGGIGLFIIGEEGTFTNEHLARLVEVSHIATGVIRNTQLYAEATRHAEEAEALRRGSIAISSSLDYRTVLEEITKQAKQLLRADGSRIHLLDTEDELLTCVIALHPHADEVMKVQLRPGEGLTGYVLQQGKPMLANRPVDHPQSVQVPGTPEQEEEVLALAPLKIRQRAMGVMTVQRDGYDHPFSEADLYLLTAFASQAAVAIENAHLYGQIEAQAQRLEEEVIARTRELSLSETRYRSLVETSLTGIFQLDTQAQIKYANSQLLQMLELPAGEARSRSVVDFLAPEYRSEVIRRTLASIRGEGPDTEVYEVELLSWTGRRIHTLLAVTLLSNEDDEPEGITGLVLDISTQKSLEAALMTERDRLDAIITNVGDAVVVTDPNGIIEYVNTAWENLNGYAADEVLGKPISLVKSGRHGQEFYVELWDTILSGRVWRGEVVNRKKDGSLYEAALSITPVMDEAEHVVNFVGVQHDISILKELDRLRSQFVSDVSHELRTPLTNIRLYLDLLRQTEYDQRASRYMETLSRESERLADLIEDLLSLSRLEADAHPFNVEQVDINHLLGALVQDRERLAAQRGLDLRLECEAKLPLAMGDEQLLTQVFTNLLTNSLNYTPEGGTITIRTKSHSSDDEDWIAVEVEDTGYGIPPKEQPLIFRRFFRGHASLPTQVPGTGLGLSICKEIAERHGGRITVESEGIPGLGSRFTVWLPLPEV